MTYTREQIEEVAEHLRLRGDSYASDMLLHLQAELRRLTPRRDKLNNLQFDAIVRLKRLRPETPTCKAARDVFTQGMTMYAAAKAHGVSEGTVQSTCGTIRQALEDCYTVITGEVRS